MSTELHSNRVLVLTTTFPRWADDTTPSFVFELSIVLRHKGLDIEILAPHHQRAKCKEDLTGLTVQRFRYFIPTKYQRIAYEGGVLSNLNRSILAKMQVPFFVIMQLWSTLKIVRRDKVNVIHSHWIIPSGLSGAICAKFLGVKHVVTIHAADILALERLPFKRNITDFIIKNSKQITVVSSYMYEKLIGLVSPGILQETTKKTKIIPMGTHVTLLQNRISKLELKKKYGIDNRFVVLFIGRLVEKKGVPYLLEAMPQIVSQHPDLKLVICGDGPMRAELKNLTEQLGLEEHVSFVGYVTGQKKVDYLSLSDIVIVPSILTESGDTEGMPVVVMEGLAAGKIIIASNVGGIKDAIEDRYNGFLIDPESPNQIAERTLEILNSQAMTKRMSEKAAETGKRYDWQNIGEQYWEIMQTLL